jgi:hypothetical protein
MKQTTKVETKILGIPDPRLDRTRQFLHALRLGCLEAWWVYAVCQSRWGAQAINERESQWAFKINKSTFWTHVIWFGEGLHLQFFYSVASKCWVIKTSCELRIPFMFIIRWTLPTSHLCRNFSKHVCYVKSPHVMTQLKYSHGTTCAFQN